MIELGFKFGLGLFLAYLVICSPLGLLVMLCEMSDARQKRVEDQKQLSAEELKDLKEEQAWTRWKWVFGAVLLVMLAGAVLVH